MRVCDQGPTNVQIFFWSQMIAVPEWDLGCGIMVILMLLKLVTDGNVCGECDILFTNQQ